MKRQTNGVPNPAKHWRLVCALIFIQVVLFASFSRAEDKALIIGIGQYTHQENNLRGIDIDRDRAKNLATHLGFAAIREIADTQATRREILDAIDDLAGETGAGDRVFIYYSGHGFQIDSKNAPSGCDEVIVPHDETYITDYEIAAKLKTIKAKEIIVVFDSCFSGSDKIKGPRGGESQEFMAKDFGQSSDRGCGDAVNKNIGMFGRSLKENSKVVFLAATQDNEVALATPRGSLFTTAIDKGITQGKADANSDGKITANEAGKFAEKEIEDYCKGKPCKPHHPKVNGDGNTELTYGAQPSGEESGSAPKSNAGTLEDIFRLRDSGWKVTILPDKPVYKIGDEMRLTVSTDRSGYLTVLYVGSDGKTVDVLFPNGFDRNNRIETGKDVTLPSRSGWNLKALGPSGTDHVLAVVTGENIGDLKNVNGASASSDFVQFTDILSASSRQQLLRNIGVSGAKTKTGTFGAALIKVDEIQ